MREAPTKARRTADRPAWRITVARSTDTRSVRALDPHAATSPPRARFLSDAVATRRCLVATADDILVGFLVLGPALFGFAFVSLVHVAPAQRRRGIATALLHAAERRWGRDRVFTSTNTSNQPMRKLLPRAGYRRCGRIDALDEGDPELVFVKRLAQPARD